MDVLPRIIDTFVRDTPARLAELRAALERGDSAEVRRMAHTVKSSSKLLGATALAQSCAEAEALAAHGELARLDSAMLARLETEFRHVAAELSELAGGGVPCSAT